MNPPEQLTAPPALHRALGALDYFTLGFGSIIGVGWIVVMNDWLERGGPAGAALAFLLGGILLLPIGVVYGRLTARIPLADSEIAYTRELFPPWASFAVGWMMALAYLVVCPFEAVAVAELGAQIVPGLKQLPLYRVGESTVYLPGLVLGLALVGIITTINYCGVHHSLRLQKYFTFGLLAVFCVFASLGPWRGQAENLLPPFAHDQGLGGRLASTFAVIGIVPYFLAGFETISRCSEERSLEFRKRLFTRITLLAIGLAVFFYVSVILVTASLYPWPQLAKTESATTVAFHHAFGSDLLVNLILFGAILSLIKVFNGCFLAATRLLFAMGRAGLMAKGFGEVHARFLTPTRTILFAGLFSAFGCFFGKPVLDLITGVGAFAFTVGWFAASVAYCRGAGGRLETIKDRLLGYAAALVAFCMGAMKLIPLLPVSFKPREYVALLGWVVLGLVFWWLRPLRQSGDKSLHSKVLA